jgi:hypothetical protein
MASPSQVGEVMNLSNLGPLVGFLFILYFLVTCIILYYFFHFAFPYVVPRIGEIVLKFLMNFLLVVKSPL